MKLYQIENMGMYQKEKLHALNLPTVVLENSVNQICDVLKEHNLSLNQSEYVLDEVRKTLKNKPLWSDSLRAKE